MHAEPRVSIHPDSKVLMAAIAARLITKLVDVQDKHGEATVVLTGGTVGIGTLKAVADSAAAPAVDWSRVNFWWGDERFVAADSARLITAVQKIGTRHCCRSCLSILPVSTSPAPQTISPRRRRRPMTTRRDSRRQQKPNTQPTCLTTGRKVHQTCHGSMCCFLA